MYVLVALSVPFVWAAVLVVLAVVLLRPSPSLPAFLDHSDVVEYRRLMKQTGDLEKERNALSRRWRTEKDSERADRLAVDLRVNIHQSIALNRELEVLLRETRHVPDRRRELVETQRIIKGLEELDGMLR